jgi:hypothetical protein
MPKACSHLSWEHFLFGRINQRLPGRNGATKGSAFSTVAKTIAGDERLRTTAVTAGFFLLLGFAALWMSSTCDAAERRVALVVGAANYAHAPELAHTLDDARDVAAALTRLSFDVDLVLNPDRIALENAARRFGEKSHGADAALFYYSGHALETKGVNWILPVSADVRNDRVLSFEAVDLDTVQEQIEGLARVSIIILDACRDDPFKQRFGVSRQITGSGLAVPNETSSGTYIAFATAPGVVAADGNGPHSPFTGALLKYIETPGLELREMMSKVIADVEGATDDRQIPWEHSTLKGDFFFNPANSEKAAETIVRAINGPNPQVDLDALFWESVDKKKAADLNAYLLKFPQGAFVELARNRLAELQVTPIAPPKQPNPKLLDALSVAQVYLSPTAREGFAAAYQAAPEHKALAAYLAGSSKWLANRQSAQDAEDSVLEACEIASGAPCVLVAVDDNVVFASDSASRAMPRVRYAGTFNPERIPAVPPPIRQRPDVLGYSAAPNSKAAAYHPSGYLFIVNGAPSLHDAEQKVLSLCNDDPIRGGQGGPCFLYASNNEVVLSRRSKVPVTAPAAEAQTDVVKPPASTTAFHDAFAAQLERALPTLGAAQRDSMASAFEVAPTHKAFAVHSRSGGGWRFVGWPTAEGVEEAALEGCQIYYGEACALIAVDDVVRVGPDNVLTARDMPRVHYQGTFDYTKIPAIPNEVRGRSEVQLYATKPDAKAIALHPSGQVYVVSGAASPNAAETSALAICNGDPVRKGQGGPCYLYATGNQVVFAKRLRMALTPPADLTHVAPAPAPKPVSADDDAVIALLAVRLKMKLPKEELAGLQLSARNYVTYTAAGHRAMAVGPIDISVASGEPTVVSAQALALERCQLQSATPCSPLAIDRNVMPAPADGKWPLYDMPRYHYEGAFDPTQIPGLPGAEVNRPDVAQYIHAPSPKAAVLQASGKIFVVSGANSQMDAEAQAFTKCGNPSCLLYAAGNRVILQQRLTQPRPLGNTLADVLSYAFVRNGVKLAAEYSAFKPHKSTALFPELSTTENSAGYRSGDYAARTALEVCGLKFNTACITLSTDDSLIGRDPSTAPRRIMPRLSYRGPYRPEMVPVFDTPPALALDYVKMRAPKAMAIRPVGPKIAAESGATLAEAEAKALARCTDPDSPYPCFLYAANDDVILPLRRTEPDQ